MDEVADIVSLPKLDDTLVHESIADAKTKRNDTVEALHTFDSTQTAQLVSIEESIKSMKNWVTDVEGLFKEGLTDVNFSANQWTSMAVGSDITKQLTAMGMSVGNILGKNEASLLIEQAISKDFVVDEYNAIDEVSDIAGTYYTLADGRILREFYGPSGAITYTFVEHIPKEKVGGAIESGEKFFSWMSIIADVVPGVSNAKAGIEGFFGVNPITGDKISGLEQGIALTAILGGPLIKLGTKVGKGAINMGKEVVGQVKNVLHPDKVKEVAKKVYDDYIKSPLQKGYTYFKNYTKKLGDVKTPLTYEAATPLGSIKVPKTVSEVTQDLKESTIQMAKKLDEKIGGKGTGSTNLTEPSLPNGSKPKGEYTKGDSHGVKKENETADFLANKGYEIKMLNEVNGGNGHGIKATSNPDFLIEGKVFDCYAPTPNTKTDNVLRTITSKTKTQAERIVLNVDNFPPEKILEITEGIQRKANPNGDLKNLKELLIVNDGKITRVFGEEK
jgi:hypothetical protein